MTLSQKRALAVRTQLIRAGVPAERIHISVYGESNPAVITPDGKIEPLQPQHNYPAVISETETKVAAEKLVLEANGEGGVLCSACRCFRRSW